MAQVPDLPVCGILFLFASCCASGAPPDFLLPDGVTTTKQSIELTIDPARNTFRGWEHIEDAFH